MTAATRERLGDLAEVDGPVHVEMKGLAAPLALYELRGLSGRFGRRQLPRGNGTGRRAEVELPLGCWIVDGKVVRAERTAGARSWARRTRTVCN